MKKYRIYTIGKMRGITLIQQMLWRNQIEEFIRANTDKKVEFIHPPLFYNYENKDYKSEREIKEWELAQIRNSDIVIVNLDEIDDSVGSHFELATVDAVNSFGNKHIFIIGYNPNKSECHPWIKESLHREESSVGDVARYIIDYLLN